MKSAVAIKVYSNFNIYDQLQDNQTVDLLKEVIGNFSLNFPKINKCYGLSIDEKGVIYSVHELATESLKDKLEKKLNLSEKHEIVKQILSIMTYLNKKKIVHRDLKPENFLISKSGELQICDFGTIRKLKNDESLTANSSYTVKYAPLSLLRD